MSVYWNVPGRAPAGAQRSEQKPSRSIQLHKMDICGEDRDVSIRLVETVDKIQAACDLINDRYGWRGYGAGHIIPSSVSHMTFTAEVDEDIVGTITLAVDSRRGLAADQAFKSEIDGFRARGGKVCELTKFAFDPAIQSKALMAALFHIVFVYGYRTYGCTHLFIEVNPRHVRFYRSMLGFEPIGSVRVNESVAAPAQLMWLKVDAIRHSINRFAGSGDARSSRSLYAHFLSPREESGIYSRLTGLRADDGAGLGDPAFRFAKTQDGEGGSDGAYR